MAIRPPSPNIPWLSFEIVSHIIEYVPRRTGWNHDVPRLSPLATVSSQWQMIVESILFRKIAIDFADFAVFTERFSKSCSRWRRRFLKDVYINMNGIGAQLEFNQDPVDSVAHDPNLTVYSEELTAAIRTIWKEFNSWGADFELIRLDLVLPAHPFIVQTSDDSSLLPRIPYICIYDTDSRLDKLSKIQNINTYAKESRVSSSSILNLVTTMPDIEHIYLSLDDHEMRDLEWRKVLRQNFAKALVDLGATNHNIKSAAFHLRYDVNLDERRMPSSLIDVATGDILSRSIRTFSTNLTELILTGTQLSTELLWPSKTRGDSDNEPPEWPHMKRFIVRTSHETADGKYYLLPADESFPSHFNDAIPMEIRDPELLELELEDNPDLVILHEMGMHPRYTFRLRPDHELFTELALAIACAAQRMPKLEILSFQILKNTYDLEESYGFNYLARQQDGGSPARVDWMFMCAHEQLLDWEPSEEIRELWGAKCGGDLDESIITQEVDSDDEQFLQRRFRDGRQINTKTMQDQYERWEDYLILYEE